MEQIKLKVLAFAKQFVYLQVFLNLWFNYISSREMIL